MFNELSIAQVHMPSYLYRSLVPSWRFFSNVIDVPVLHYRLSADGETFGEWTIGLKKIAPSAWSLILNPYGNFLLAANSLLQQLESDVAALKEENKEEFEFSVSFSLVRNLTENLIRTSPEAKTEFYQFKVSRVRQGLSTEHGTDFLISKVLKL